jgi:GT2 family glycosyltransferase
MSHPRVAVVVPVYNAIEATTRFLRAFRDVRYPNYSIIIVDDGSTDGTSGVVARGFPEVILLRGSGELWWSGATNAGVVFAQNHGFDFVLTINNDAQMEPTFLDYLVATAESRPRHIVGSRINFLEPSDKVWAVGGYMDWPTGRIFQLHDHGKDEHDVLALRTNPVQVEILTGCGTLVPIACFREVGLYDERWFPQYHGDSEFVLRAARRGYRAVVDLRAVVYNDASHSCGATCATRREVIFARRSTHYWRPMLAIHARYCPWRYRLASITQVYLPFFVGRWAWARTVRRRLLERRAKLARAG